MLRSERLTIERLQSLQQMRKSEPVCISLFMKTHRAGSDTRQDPIRLKNLIGQIKDKLSAQKMRRPDVEQLLKPLLALDADGEFWRHQHEGLAVYLADNFFQLYRLPMAISDFVAVSTRFYTRPLMPLFLADQRFLVLALGLKKVRLFEGSSFSLDEVEILDLPEPMREMFADLDVRDELQGHSTSRGTGVIFHGHDSSEQDKVRIEQYLRKVRDSVEAVLKNETAPLVLYGVSYLLSMYSALSEYSNIVPQFITGSTEMLDEAELHRRAYEIVASPLREAKAEAVQEYQAKLGTGLASGQIDTIISAAHHGRLETLFLNDSKSIWGVYDTDANALRVDQFRSDSNEDLTDLAVTECILSGGSVLLVTGDELGGADIGGVFRY